ncbi:MAG: hypothetical protein ACO34J_14570 [Prochlorothrix sp.]
MFRRTCGLVAAIGDGDRLQRSGPRSNPNTGASQTLAESRSCPHGSPLGTKTSAITEGLPRPNQLTRHSGLNPLTLVAPHR